MMSCDKNLYVLLLLEYNSISLLLCLKNFITIPIYLSIRHFFTIMFKYVLINI